jgi:hypothetical protein
MIRPFELRPLTGRDETDFTWQCVEDEMTVDKDQKSNQISCDIPYFVASVPDTAAVGPFIGADVGPVARCGVDVLAGSATRQRPNGETTMLGHRDAPCPL